MPVALGINIETVVLDKNAGVSLNNLIVKLLFREGLIYRFTLVNIPKQEIKSLMTVGSLATKIKLIHFFRKKYLFS